MSPKRPPHASSFAKKRDTMYRREVAHRAGIFFRLGYTEAQAVARLRQNAAWEFEIPGKGASANLGDKDIADIVKATFARRPSS